MTKKRIIGYGLLLISVVLLLTLSMLPGQAFARYYAGANWNAVIHDTSQTIPILTKNVRSISIPVALSEPAACALEKMRMDGTFTEFTSDGLRATISGDQATLTLGEEFPPAGTYRLVFCTADGATVLRTVIFFVNYSDG